MGDKNNEKRYYVQDFKQSFAVLKDLFLHLGFSEQDMLLD